MPAPASRAALRALRPARPAAARSRHVDARACASSARRASSACRDNLQTLPDSGDPGAYRHCGGCSRIVCGAGRAGAAGHTRDNQLVVHARRRLERKVVQAGRDERTRLRFSRISIARCADLIRYSASAWGPLSRSVHPVTGARATDQRPCRTGPSAGRRRQYGGTRPPFTSRSVVGATRDPYPPCCVPVCAGRRGYPPRTERNVLRAVRSRPFRGRSRSACQPASRCMGGARGPVPAVVIAAGLLTAFMLASVGRHDAGAGEWR